MNAHTMLRKLARAMLDDPGELSPIVLQAAWKTLRGDDAQLRAMVIQVREQMLEARKDDQVSA